MESSLMVKRLQIQCDQLKELVLEAYTEGFWSHNYRGCPSIDWEKSEVKEKLEKL